jgi:hypothetical protein
MPTLVVMVLAPAEYKKVTKALPSGPSSKPPPLTWLMLAALLPKLMAKSLMVTTFELM